MARGENRGTEGDSCNRKRIYRAGSCGNFSD